MNCNYFGKCGSCTLHDKTYEVQLDYKYEREKNRFDKLLPKDLSIDIIKSNTEQFRYRAEFRIWKTFLNNETKESPLLSYAMNDTEKNTLEIDQCSIVSSDISSLMPMLIKCLQEKEILSQKLFSCEFLNSTTGDILVTLIYHKKLEEQWKTEASLLEKELNISIIGRSRKQKEILSKDFIEEKLSINEQKYTFQYKEGGFTQPNTQVNVQMIEWVLNHTQGKGNLCELYCGGGNFTIPLSKKFDQVLATEISKTSIKSAKLNCELNNINNIEFIRMSSEEFVEALNEVRDFRRLKDINLQSYNFKNASNEKEFTTIFVDPPRAGLDDTTRSLVRDFHQIIYISCNPETFHSDLLQLKKTHTIKYFALFDQFAYTNHIECGAVLYKRV